MVGWSWQAGFIVGFDNDDDKIFQEQFDFIQEAGIAQALVAILSPIPTTPLYDRLAAAGRLDPSNSDVTFIPMGMSAETLKREYGSLMERLYEPGAYFERLFAGFRGSPAFRERRRKMDALASRRSAAVRTIIGSLGAVSQAWRLWRALHKSGLVRQLGKAYVSAWFRLNRPLGNERMPAGAFLGLCVIHWHFYNIAMRPKKGEFGTVLASTSPSGSTQEYAA